jgi:hypothetical protein
MMEALRSSEMSVLTEPHNVTSQKTPFFAARKDLKAAMEACSAIVDNHNSLPKGGESCSRLHLV